MRQSQLLRCSMFQTASKTALTIPTATLLVSPLRVNSSQYLNHICLKQERSRTDSPYHQLYKVSALPSLSLSCPSPLLFCSCSQNKIKSFTLYLKEATTKDPYVYIGDFNQKWRKLEILGKHHRIYYLATWARSQS